MSRYIDADKLKTIESIQSADFNSIESIRRWIDEQQTADVVEVVRCKDCKYRKKVLNCSYGECMYSASMVTDNDFCSNGEVKTNEQEQWDV